MPIDQCLSTRPLMPEPVNTPMPRSLVGLFACASGLSVANVYYAQPLLDQVATDFAISQAAVGGGRRRVGDQRDLDVVVSEHLDVVASSAEVVLDVAGAVRL